MKKTNKTVNGREVYTQTVKEEVCNYDGESEVIQQLLDNHPTGILSLVIDSYDYRNFIKICGTKFKEQILARDGKVVFRPDSGDPVGVSLEVMELIDEYFGHTVNSKGYKVLNPKVGMIWGDGIEIKDIKNILSHLKLNDYSSENICFGMGGGLLQRVDRDTQRFAFKCSAQKRDGEEYDIWKDPIDKSKASKRGRLTLEKGPDGEFCTGKFGDIPHDHSHDYLETVFSHGEIVKEYTFEEIRKNAEI